MANPYENMGFADTQKAANPYEGMGFAGDTPSPAPSQPAVQPVAATQPSAPVKAESQPDYYEGLPADVVAKIQEQATVPIGRGQQKKFVEKRAKRLADLERLRIRDPYIVEAIEDLNPFESAAIGVREGFETLGRGIGLLDQADKREREAFEAVKTVSPRATGGGELFAEALPFMIPGTAAAKIASTPLRVGTMAGIGASEGGIIAAGKGGDIGDIARGAVIGGTIGAGSEVLLPIANRLARRVIAKFNPNAAVDAPINPDGSPTQELQDALDRGDASMDDILELARIEASQGTGEAAGTTVERVADELGDERRRQAFEKLNLTPTQPQVTRDTDLFVTQQDLYRQGGQVRAAIDEQERVLDNALKNIGRNAGNREAASESVSGLIKTKAAKAENEINKLYREARNTAGTEKIVRLDNTVRALKSLAPESELSKGVIRALKGNLQSGGLMDNSWRASGRIDVDQVELLRQYANQLYDGANARGRNALFEFKRALDEDTFRATDNFTGAGDKAGLYQQARDTYGKYKTEIGRKKVDKWDARKTAIIDDILTNKITTEELPDKILKRSSNYKASDLEDLKKYFESGTPEEMQAGMAAWDNLRAEAFGKIYDSAMRGPLTQFETRNLSRAGLESGLKQIGPDKMKVLFTPEEMGLVSDIMRVAALKEPPPGLYTGTGPSGPAIRAAVGRIEGLLQGNLAMFYYPIKAIVENTNKLRDIDKILRLVSRAEKVAAQNEARQLRLLRQGPSGALMSLPPAAGIAATQEEE